MNTWLISDTHFFHEKIKQYCDRPDDWQDRILNNWKNIIKNDDTVYHLGDFMFGKIDHKINYLKEFITGNIILIKGNHERSGVSWFKNNLNIELIKNKFYIINVDDVKIALSHVPLNSNILVDNDIKVNIHGHIHNNYYFIKKEKDMVWFNVSVEQLNYKPINICNIIEYINDLKDKKELLINQCSISEDRG